MAFTGSYLTRIFRQHLLEGVHDFRDGEQVFKIALYTEDASLDADTPAYTSDNEVVSAGYPAGGLSLSVVGPLGGAVSFAPVSISGASFAARGALIYNSTPAHSYSNPAVAVLDFGSNKLATPASFALSFAPVTSPAALIRLD